MMRISVVETQERIFFYSVNDKLPIIILSDKFIMIIKIILIMIITIL